MIHDDVCFRIMIFVPHPYGPRPPQTIKIKCLIQLFDKKVAAFMKYR